MSCLRRSNCPILDTMKTRGLTSGTHFFFKPLKEKMKSFQELLEDCDEVEKNSFWSTLFKNLVIRFFRPNFLSLQGFL